MNSYCILTHLWCSRYPSNVIGNSWQVKGCEMCVLTVFVWGFEDFIICHLLPASCTASWFPAPIIWQDICVLQFINGMWKDVWVAVKVNMRVKMMRMTAVCMGQEILEIFCSHLCDIDISAAWNLKAYHHVLYHKATEILPTLSLPVILRSILIISTPLH